MLGILKSRKFQAAIAGILAAVVVSLVPQLAEHQEALTELIKFVVGAYIAGHAYTDAAAIKSKKDDDLTD